MELLEEIAKSNIKVKGCIMTYDDLKYLDKNEIKKVAHYCEKIRRRKVKHGLENNTAK